MVQEQNQAKEARDQADRVFDEALIRANQVFDRAMDEAREAFNESAVLARKAWWEARAQVKPIKRKRSERRENDFDA